jgi:hypothetical protein
MYEKFIAKANLINNVAKDPSDAAAQNIAQKAIPGKAQLSAPFLSTHQTWRNEKKEKMAELFVRMLGFNR